MSLTSPYPAADTLRSDRRAGLLLSARRREAEAAASARRGRLAARGPVTAVRSGGRLVVVSPQAAA